MSIRNDIESRLARTVRIGQLLDCYGVLLTERQREFVRLHHNEDLSFGEIAKDFGISRQAVHDAVHQAESAMENYESALGLFGRSTDDRKSSDSVSKVLRPILSDLEDCRKRLSSQGIIYDPKDHVKALDSVISRLQALVGDEYLFEDMKNNDR